jgi:hypothetical protein
MGFKTPPNDKTAEPASNDQQSTVATNTSSPTVSTNRATRLITVAVMFAALFAGGSYYATT